MEQRGARVLLCLAAVLVLGFSAWADSIVVGTATGTGFIVSSDGYILTNEHVVEKATEVKVTIGTREYTATVVATLPGSDLALLKVDARGLPAVHLGNSDQMDIGDEVYALGCPGGVCGTATMGRIANIGVSVRTDGERVLQNMLMVDITTDHGSSGGPLVNTRGEVVGITTAGRQGAFGFSIPINQAIPLLQRIPGFSTAQMGPRTQELTFREIRALVGPSTTFVVAPVTVALASLVPEVLPGFEVSYKRDCPLSSTACILGHTETYPNWGRLPSAVDRLGIVTCVREFVDPLLPTGFVPRFKEGVVCYEASFVSSKGGAGFYAATVLAARLPDAGLPEHSADHIRTLDMEAFVPPRSEYWSVRPGVGYRYSLSVVQNGTPEHTAIAVGSLKAQAVLNWRITVDNTLGGVLPGIASPFSMDAAFRGTATLVIGDLLLAVSLLAERGHSGLGYSGRTLMVGPGLRFQRLFFYSDGGCLACQYTETDDAGRIVVQRTEELICRTQFMAEFERVFLLAVKALLDALPKG